MSSLTSSEIMTIVNRYIGVSDGYLGNFSYRTHADFYPEYCNLDINPYDIPGTTRERFLQILSSADPRSQAAIIRGVLERFPLGAGPTTRTTELAHRLRAIADRLEGCAPVPSPRLADQIATVERALADAEVLIREQGATSGVDRIHTALHGLLRHVCQAASIAVAPDAAIPALLKALRDHHPAFAAEGPRATDITQILRACGSIADVLQPLRNQASGAHPNAEVLAPAEAMLVINVVRSLIHYVGAKLQASGA